MPNTDRLVPRPVRPPHRRRRPPRRRRCSAPRRRRRRRRGRDRGRRAATTAARPRRRAGDDRRHGGRAVGHGPHRVQLGPRHRVGGVVPRRQPTAYFAEQRRRRRARATAARTRRPSPRSSPPARPTSGVASDELQLINANKEGADFVILGAMYQRSPYGYAWLAEHPDRDGRGPRRQADRPGDQGDQIRVDAMFKVNGLEPDYEIVPMSFDPQPLVDGDVDVITRYVTNQPIQLAAAGHRDRVGAVLRLRPEGLRRRDLRVAGLPRGQPRPARRLPRRAARRASRPTSPTPRPSSRCSSTSTARTPTSTRRTPRPATRPTSRCSTATTPRPTGCCSIDPPYLEDEVCAELRGGRRDRPAAGGRVPRHDSCMADAHDA